MPVGKLASYGKQENKLFAFATFDLRFDLGQLDPRVLCGRTTSGTYWDSAGVLQTVGPSVPRLTYDPADLSKPAWLMCEETRTNSIRNPRMIGAEVGSPGTLPTNWLAPTSFSGLSREIVSVGVENGISYVDLRYFGTANASTPSVIGAEGFNTVAAVNGQTWSHSMFLKVVGGTSNGIAFRHDMRVQSVSSFLQAIGLIFLSTPTSAPLREQRTISTGTITSEGAAFIAGRLLMVPTEGAAIDITLRIGLPQLELGASASSPILPPEGQIAAATRTADNNVVTDLSWYNPAGGVLYVEYSGSVPILSGTSRRLVALSDGTANNRIVMSFGTGGGIANYFAADGGTEIVIVRGIAMSLSGGRVAARIAADDYAISYNGQAVIKDTSASVPVVNQLRIGWAESGGGASLNTLNGGIHRITYTPNTAAPDSGIQALTS
jgi:hypothetical protein